MLTQIPGSFHQVGFGQGFNDISLYNTMFFKNLGIMVQFIKLIFEVNVHEFHCLIFIFSVGQN